MDDSLCVLATFIYLVFFAGLVFWSNKKPKPVPEKKAETFVYTHDEFMRDMLDNVPLEVIMDKCRVVGGVPRQPKKEEANFCPTDNSSSVNGMVYEPRYDYFGADLNNTTTGGMTTVSRVNYACEEAWYLRLKITLDSSGQI